MSAGDKIQKLRVEAEKIVKDLGGNSLVQDDVGESIKKVLHELQVHQLELEMQNEELRRVQSLLEIEKSRYNDLFEYAPVGYILTNEAGVIHEVNQTFCSIIEMPRKEIAGKPLHRFLDPESQDTYYLHLQKLQAEQKPCNCVLHLTNKKTLWVKMESKIFKTEGADHILIQSSLSDISSNKLNEENLLRLSTAFEQSANSIMITDTLGNIQYGNPKFFETTGYTPEEIIGENPRIIKHENSDIDYKSMWETISSGNIWKGEFLNKNKQGNLFWEIATITPVKNFEGKIINYLAIKEDITQRKIAEKNLQRAKDFYLRLLEDFPVMVWQSDRNGNFNFFNKTFQAFTGIAIKPEQTQRFYDLILPRDREIFADAFAKSLKNQTPFVVEYRLKDRYDSYRWVLNHGRPFTDMDGNYGGFIATCTDIHDRKLVEERLIESEDRYRRMFEDSSLGIFKLDRSFQFISANMAFAQMFGYNNTVDFLIDINNSPDFFFPAFNSERHFIKNLVKSSENRFIVEKELFKRDKSKIYTVIHLRKVHERTRDKQFYMEGFIEDVTTRKLSEIKLQVSEQKFKSLFEKSYDAIIILDGDFIVECNKKASEIFNRTSNSLIKKKFSSLSPEINPLGESNEEILHHRILQALKGEPQNFEWIHLRGSKTFDAEISLIRIMMNNKYMVQAIVRDISEKKLAEKQLKQARDDAEKARMAQSEFLSLMSHEIRTPLNAVVSLTDLMLHEDQAPEQKENLNSVKISAAHLLRLIDDILDYNKIESGNIQFDLESFNIRDLVRQLQQAMEIKAREKGIKLLTLVADNVPAILIGDTLRLKQVLFNLVSNAIKFTSHGQVSLRVEKRNQKTNDVYFEIEDTGIGISEARLDAIFDKFTQEESSTSRKYGGSGLGLTICKKLVELQNGKIYATSQKYKGSVFTFYLPFEEGIKLSGTFTERKTGKLSYTLDGLRILLVEDDKMNQFVATKVLEKKWKSDLHIVSSGDDALKSLSEKYFDLVLMDILLPGMDGYELTRLIRSNFNNKIINPSIPIIALTADAFVETRQKSIEAGMNDFVSKPFDYDNLFEKLFSYLSGKKGQIA